MPPHQQQPTHIHSLLLPSPTSPSMIHTLLLTYSHTLTSEHPSFLAMFKQKQEKLARHRQQLKLLQEMKRDHRLREQVLEEIQVKEYEREWAEAVGGSGGNGNDGGSYRRGGVVGGYSGGNNDNGRMTNTNRNRSPQYQRQLQSQQQQQQPQHQQPSHRQPYPKSFHLTSTTPRHPSKQTQRSNPKYNPNNTQPLSNNKFRSSLIKSGSFSSIINKNNTIISNNNNNRNSVDKPSTCTTKNNQANNNKVLNERNPNTFPGGGVATYDGFGGFQETRDNYNNTTIAKLKKKKISNLKEYSEQLEQQYYGKPSQQHLMVVRRNQIMEGAQQLYQDERR